MSGLVIRWSSRGEKVPELVAQRRAIYGGELGWVEPDADVAWDRYDLHSTTLLCYDGGALVASGRLTVESDGPSELGDLVDWRAALPAALRDRPAAEWSRVMIAPDRRRQGLFRAMYEATRSRARDRGVVLLGGASVPELRPRYERLGFHYLEVPFRSPFFARSPVYYPAYQRIG
jgi:GNAT superfamily N-acetyltransferase